MRRIGLASAPLIEMLFGGTGTVLNDADGNVNLFGMNGGVLGRAPPLTLLGPPARGVPIQGHRALVQGTLVTAKWLQLCETLSWPCASCIRTQGGGCDRPASTLSAPAHATPVRIAIYGKVIRFIMCAPTVHPYCFNDYTHKTSKQVRGEGGHGQALTRPSSRSLPHLRTPTATTLNEGGEVICILCLFCAVNH
jgi:hypothetical protein